MLGEQISQTRLLKKKEEVITLLAQAEIPESVRIQLLSLQPAAKCNERMSLTFRLGMVYSPAKREINKYKRTA